MNFVIYILSYFFIIFSILGYGYLFHNIFFKSEKINLGYLGIFGIFSLTLISYLSNFFIEHNKYHNLVIMVFGFALNIALFHQNLVSY